jgi:hypothetical protein
MSRREFVGTIAATRLSGGVPGLAPESAAALHGHLEVVCPSAYAAQITWSPISWRSPSGIDDSCIS